MTAETLVRPGPISRIYGLGSLFAKSLRDSRRGMLIVTGLLGVLILTSGSFMASQWGTPETRAEGVQLTTALPPIIIGLFGGPAIHPETLGGFTSWRFGIMFFLIPGIWSLMALSGTLVGEAQRGSLDFVAGQPLSRRRVALEKVGAHVVAVAIAMLILALVLWGVGAAFATLPGDEIPLDAALGYVLLMGLVALTAGAVAFGLAPFVGRGGAAGIAAVILFASWIINGYREALPVFDALSPVSLFAWTADHRPIAGVYDWPSLIPLALIVVVGLVVGIVAFERRDIGHVGALRLPSLPQALLGTSGPMLRSFSERLTGAVAWGAGIGAYALIIATSGDELQRVIVENPTMANLFQALYPDVDVGTPGFALQLLFMQFGTIFIGLAAATLVGGWASDESEGRLEMPLATAVTRARWFLSSGLGVYLAIILAAAVVALITGMAVLLVGQNPMQPVVGSSVLVLYGAAMAGIGIALAGLWRPTVAAAVVAAVVVAQLLIDILAPLLELPGWVSDLVLASHYGEPMIGNWDPVGVAISLVLAFGGLVLGAWGFSRRDLKG